MVNGTTPAPVTTQLATTTVAPAEEVPEPPEVEQHSSMTIFFILLVLVLIWDKVHVEYLSLSTFL